MAENKQVFIHFFTHKPRFSQLKTQNGRAWSVRKGLQNAFPCADTLILSIKKNQNVSQNKETFLERINLYEFDQKDSWVLVTKVHVTMCIWCCCASFEDFLQGKRLLHCPFHISTVCYLILINALRNGSVLARSIACRGATETKEMSEDPIVPNMAQTTQQSSAADWNRLLNDVNWLIATEHVRNKYSLLKSLCLISYCILSETLNNVNFNLITAFSCWEWGSIILIQHFILDVNPY